MTSAGSPSCGRAATEQSSSRQVTVRYWAAARAAAGCPEETVKGATLADVLAEVTHRHAERPRFAAVLAVSSLLVGDRPIGSRDPGDVPLVTGDIIEVLPPFAGG